MVSLDWPPPDHLGVGRKSRQFLPAQPSCRDPGTGPRAAPPTVAAQTRIVSKARIRLDFRKSVRSFKGIICVDISEFESGLCGAFIPFTGFASSAVIGADPWID